MADEDANDTGAEITAYPVDAASKPAAVAATEQKSYEPQKAGSVVSLYSFRKKH